MTYTHEFDYIQAGTSAGAAKSALILLHGRGSSARGIMPLVDHFHVKSPYVLAPEATNNSWYPLSFMAPKEDNQPALDTAIVVVDHAVEKLLAEGFSRENIFIIGFSQGACLALEYAARKAARYGGIVAFTGGLIGDQLDETLYAGDFRGTPILISGGDQDAHVPLVRMEQSRDLLKELGANVRLELYPGKPHSISMEELILADEYIFLHT